VGDVSIGSSASPEPKPARPGKIDRLDPLPSLNLIYKLKDDEITPMNLRVNYFRSIGRPSFREFSVVQLYDYVLNAPVFGNPDLKLTTIDNYDVRLERFFSGGNNVSLSGFYKHFQNHIELLATLAGGFTWRNAPESYVYGAELEGRVKLMPHLEWRGNLTLMESNSRLETNVSGETTSYTTPMFGQAPYIVNSMLTWTADSARLSISVSYNVQGPKLAVSNSELDPKGIRAYEMPRHLIDITVNKQFGKHWGLRLRGRNLLNTSQRRTYLFNSGYDIDFDKYTYGPEYALTVSYTIR
jgi:outer membrane receptor protein involved in Fe transport